VRNTANRVALVAILTFVGCAVTHPVGSPPPTELAAGPLPPSQGALDTRRRIAPGYECRLEKGKPSVGLWAFCSVDRDTAVVGEPVIFQFGLVNVGADSAGVEAGLFSLVGGNLPALFIADPGGFEYPYISFASELHGIMCNRAVALAPGDTLSAIFQVTYYGFHDLLFPSPGRCGIYCGYYMPGDECHRGVEIASGIAWVQVVPRDSPDSLAWDVFKKTKRCLVGYDASTNDTVMTAFREVVDRYPRSAYYPYSLYMYGRCLEFAKRYDEAIGYFSKYRAEYPNSLLARESLFQIAQCFHQSGRHDEAMVTFEAACSADKWNWKGLPWYRQKYVEGGQWPGLIY
jgi:hypothetical protein